MKRLFLLLSGILLISIIVFLSDQPYNNNATDLLEAYRIANTEAVNWDKSAKPYFITSVDDPAESRFVKGSDGKRSFWNIDFVAGNTDRHLIVTVHEKAVVNKIEAVSHTNLDCIIHMENLHITTKEAARIAAKTYGLLPGKDWAQGYHFVLEANGSALILSVVGLNTDGDRTRVLFHAETGTVIQ